MVFALIRAVCRLGLLYVFFVVVVAPIAAGMLANHNLQECWKEQGYANFGCKGDGTYNPRPLLAR